MTRKIEPDPLRSFPLPSPLPCIVRTLRDMSSTFIQGAPFFSTSMDDNGFSPVSLNAEIPQVEFSFVATQPKLGLSQPKRLRLTLFPTTLPGLVRGISLLLCQWGWFGHLEGFHRDDHPAGLSFLAPFPPSFLPIYRWPRRWRPLAQDPFK